MPPRPFPDPYRFLFPLGVVFALWGVVVWPLAAAGLIPYPAPLHRALMLQGFEMCFVLGFLLTAMPGFTGGQRFRPFEVVIAAVAMASLFVGAAAGAFAWAAGSFAFAVLWIAVAVARRLLLRRGWPPEEFMFVGLGLGFGIVGGVWLTGIASGAWNQPAPDFAVRLVSLGMILSMVLGLGTLLVPAFAGQPTPLALPGIAGPHERHGRRELYLVLMAALVAAFVAEGLGHPGWGAWLRAGAGTVMLVLGWKIAGPGTRGDTYAVALRITGWLLLAGLWLAAVVPLQRMAGEHVIYIGGFGLLTVGIGTRVVVSHGKHPPQLDRRLVSAPLIALLVVAALLRAGAEFAIAWRMALFGAAGAAWVIAWAVWAWRAMPLVFRLAREGLIRPS